MKKLLIFIGEIFGIVVADDTKGDKHIWLRNSGRRFLLDDVEPYAISIYKFKNKSV